MPSMLNPRTWAPERELGMHLAGCRVITLLSADRRSPPRTL
jgi:hypothetical protein